MVAFLNYSSEEGPGREVIDTPEELDELLEISRTNKREGQLSLFNDGNMWQAVYEGNVETALKYANEIITVDGIDHFRWQIERGGEGESILHLAVLQRHACLAKQLMARFPSLVSDVYTSHKYFGETALHIAVVNTPSGKDADELEIIKDLVESKAEVNGPLASGTEFLKDRDQGCLYYGQTILQFAIANRKSKIVRYLVETAGADITAVDVYGNNILHIMAYHGDFDVELFRWLKKRNEDDIKARKVAIDITKARNKDNFTAYQVGFSQGHAQILEAMKDVIWEFGFVRQYRICLDDLDPLQPHRQDESLTSGTKTLKRVSESALEIAVANKDKKILSHPLMESIIKIKWALYGRSAFMRQMFLTFFLIACYTVAISLQPSDLADRRNYSLDSDNRHPYPRLAFELASLVGSTVMVWGQMGDIFVQGSSYFRGYYFEKIVQWLFALNVWIIPILRFGVAVGMGPDYYDNIRDGENCVFGFAAIFGWFYLLEFSKGFESLGPLFLIFKRMVLEDFMNWLTLYVPLTAGFAAAFFLQMQQVPSVSQNNEVPSFDWNNYAGATLWTTRFIFLQAFFDDFRSARLPAFTQVIYFIYMFVVQVVLFNVLIAMLAETLKAIANDSKRVWRVQFASLLIQTDQTLSDVRHRHILTHLGWVDTDETNRGTGADKSHLTTSRYFIFTERDVIKRDPTESSEEQQTKHITTQTLKLIVARDKHGRGIEVYTHQAYWHGWTRDILRLIWSGGEMDGPASWWHHHNMRVKHDQNHMTLYQRVNAFMRKKEGHINGLREDQHVDLF